MKTKWLRLVLLSILLVSGAWSVNPGKADAAVLADPATETLITLADPIVVSGYNPAGVTVAGSTATIIAGGDYRATGTLANGMIAFNTPEMVTLTLDNANITNASGPAIYGINVGKTTLILAAGSTNTLSDGPGNIEKATLFSNDPLEISGSGVLNVTGVFKHAVASDDNLILSGGNITVLSATKDGFHANDDIAVTGGTITVTQAASDAFESEGTLEVASGTLALSAVGDGLKSVGALRIDGGSMDIRVGDDALTSAMDVTINGGELYLDGSGDGIDSNGTLSINGGLIVALGGSAAYGLVCIDTGEILFTGGTLVAAGGSNGTPSGSSTQHVVVLGGQTAGSPIKITHAGTNELIFVSSKDYTSLIFTAPSLAADLRYTVYSGGTISGGSNFHGLYTGATYTGGRLSAIFETTTMVSYATDPYRRYLPILYR